MFVCRNVDMKDKNLVENTSLFLKNQILNFKLLPGVKISDKEIAQLLGISRSPVREALIHLAEQGLVESRYNRGFTVKAFSIKEVGDLYTLRAALENLAVQLTTKNMDEDKLQTLKDVLNSYPKILHNNDLIAFNNADQKFHELIAVYSDNWPLSQNLKNLQGQVRLIRRYEYLRATSFQETYNEHSEILQYMSEAKSSKAQRAMSAHILRSMRVIINILKQNQ
jgi:DNA-binding GntR family transcriptional regulator